MAEQEDDAGDVFVKTMRSFLEMVLSTIPPEVAEKLLDGRPGRRSGSSS